MKKLSLFMGLACFALFGLFGYTHITKTTQSGETLPHLDLTEIKSDIPNATFVNVAPIPDEVKPVVVKNVPPVVKKETPVTTKTPTTAAIDVKPIPDYLEKGIEWLAKAQYENGGWGATQNTHQKVQTNKVLNIDPATTAFSAMALMNTGSTLSSGTYSVHINRALILLLDMTENAPKESKNITNITGTQPQRKLGQNIDLSMTAQFLARALPQTKKRSKLQKRTKAALEKCLGKIEKSQHKDGSWNDQGWAPVLQSAMANNALEMSDKLEDVKVSKETITRSKKYQQSNVSSDGSVVTGRAAGIQLYAVSSTQRATADDAKQVVELLESDEDFSAIKEEIAATPAPQVTERVVTMLKNKGVKEKEANVIANSYVSNKVASKQIQNDAVLSGFGNNGGEEYLSYMMTSESMIESSNDDWDNWHKKMNERLGKVQNGDGSWSGHHCISSPVFCTAAVIMTLTADRK